MRRALSSIARIGTAIVVAALCIACPKPTGPADPGNPGEPVDPGVVSNIVGFVLLYLGLFAAASLAMTFFSPDLETAVSSVAATLCNVGPGLSAVGPARTFAAFPGAGKLVLTLCMLLGRLELFTMVVLLLPRFWRR